MGLTNWQLFFMDLQAATTDQQIQDNEVLTQLRTVQETIFISDLLTYTYQSGVCIVGFSQVGFSEVG